MLPVVGYNRYPDEKGTEKECDELDDRTKVLMVRYNRYPDEKGTERRLCEPTVDSPVAVTTVTPMKRGLKDRYSLSHAYCG